MIELALLKSVNPSLDILLGKEGLGPGVSAGR
jgi:hypothetical protein